MYNPLSLPLRHSPTFCPGSLKPYLGTLIRLVLRTPIMLALVNKRPLLPSCRGVSAPEEEVGPQLGQRWKWGEGEVTPLWRPCSNPPGVDPPPRCINDLCRTKRNTRILYAEQTPGPAWSCCNPAACLDRSHPAKLRQLGLSPEEGSTHLC